MHPLDLRTLKTSKNPVEIDQSIEKLLASDTIDNSVISILKHRIVNDGYKPSPMTLTKIIIKTQDREIYKAFYESIKFTSGWELVDFYKNKIEDPRIEDVLLERVYELSLNVSDTFKFEAVRAVKEFGSRDTLITLQMIESELRDRAISAQNFGKNLPAPEMFEAQLNAQFYELVVDAIAAVRSRNSDPVSDRMGLSIKKKEGRGRVADGNESQPKGDFYGTSQNSPLPSRVYERLAKAKKLQSIDPENSLTESRRGAEAIAHTICLKLNIKDGSKNKKTLNDYTKMMRSDNKVKPELMMKLLEGMQQFGNSGTHDEGDEIYLVNDRIAQAVIILFENLISICESWLPEEAP